MDLFFFESVRDRTLYPLTASHSHYILNTEYNNISKSIIIRRE